jgi:hypothetical protein
MVLFGTISLLVLSAQAEPAPRTTPVAPLPSPTPAPTPPPDGSDGASDPLGLGLALGPAWRPAGTNDGGQAHVVGYSLQVELSYRYLTLASGLELGAGFHFSHERYSRCARWGSLVGAGGGGSCLADALLRHGDFLALQSVGLRFARLRPHATLGAGITLAELVMPGSGDAPVAQATRLVIRPAVGVSWRLRPDLDLAVELAHTFLLRSPRREIAGQSRADFTSRQTLAFWVIYAPSLPE